MRVHRCFIVNLQAVASLERDGSKTVIVLTGKPKAPIPVSRAQAGSLRKSLGQLVRH
jgi:DNA-binding LytR/AlgR family response regulator